MPTHTESFTIQKRWPWLSSVTVEIACEVNAPMGVKLGAAVKVAFERKMVLRGADLTGADLTGADLRDADLRGAVLRDADLRDADLRGADLADADLRGADLTDADLRGAVLTGADLRGADLRGADLRDEKIARIFAIVVRLDGYTFHGVQLLTGAVKVDAGCRWFTVPEYRAHVAEEYPDTDKARETLDILDFIEKRSVGLPAPVVEAETSEAEAV